jgi:hypothetical protein
VRPWTHRTSLPSFPVLFLFGAGGGTQGLVHERPVLYYRFTPAARDVHFLSQHLLKSFTKTGHRERVVSSSGETQAGSVGGVWPVLRLAMWPSAHKMLCLCDLTCDLWVPWCVDRELWASEGFLPSVLSSTVTQKQ